MTDQADDFIQDELPFDAEFIPVDPLPEPDDIPVDVQLRILHERVDRLDQLVGVLYEATCDEMQPRLARAIARSRR